MSNAVLDGPRPEPGGYGNFKLMAFTEEEEDQFDYTEHRVVEKPCGPVASVGHLVKGALGAGILSGHYGYMKAGVAVAVPINVILGFYVCFCFYTLITAARVLYKRTRVPSMSYPDIGEAAFSCSHCKFVRKFAKCARFFIDSCICLELFGACATYQLIIAKSIKQLVENVERVELEGIAEGYPNFRVYLAAMIIPLIAMCWIRHLKYLAPFSLIANTIIFICVCLALYYALQYNPKFEGMRVYSDFYSSLQFLGMLAFSMSPIGVVIPVEQNLTNPKLYGWVLLAGSTIVTLFVFGLSFFGYAAFLEKSETPITLNFPLMTLPKILKGLIVVMVYFTHALNFWVPFNLTFYYIERKVNPNKAVKWELFYRALFVFIITIIAMVFPNINGLIGFLGSFCLSNMAFIWPHIIKLVVIWKRPGFGRYKWRLLRFIVCLFIGVAILVLATTVAAMELFKTFVQTN